MRTALLKELEHLDRSRSALRKFGVVVGGVFGTVALIVLWRRGWDPGVLPLALGVPGVGLVVGGLLIPERLVRVYLIWMGLALVMGAIMTRVILTLVYVLMVTPIGLALRVFGKDLLDLRRQPGAATYWRDRSEDAPLRERMNRLY